MTDSPAPFPMDEWTAAKVERCLAELRVRSLELRLALATCDHLGLLVKDGLCSPWSARAILAELEAPAQEPAAE